MSLGLSPRQQDMFATTTSFCEPLVAPDSIYGLLHRECHRLFPDEMFADLFCDVGRRSVPPMIVAVVMVLQRLEGCSDREAVERFCFDARWKYAAGGLSFDHPGFVHTVLVDMRARLARSEQPDRIFEVTLDAATRAGLVGRRRVLDSTPLYDAVATMDTVTLVRSAIRGVLAVCDAELETQLRAVLGRDDEYRAAGKPVCDYDDPQAREALIDALAQDALAVLVALEGLTPSAEGGQTDRHRPRPNARRARGGCRSTATRPTAKASCWALSSRPTRRSTARSSRPSRPAAGSPRTPSTSPFTPAPSVAPPAAPSRSSPPETGSSRTSARPARIARWPPSAPPRPTDGPSMSAPTSSSSPARASANQTPPGRPTTPPPAPRSTARSHT